MKNNAVPYRYDVRKEKNKSKQISVPGPLKSLKKKISIIMSKQKYCDSKNSAEVKTIYHGILW